LRLDVDNKKTYGDELFIYAMVLLEEAESQDREEKEELEKTE